MARFGERTPEGVIPAVLLPFRADFSGASALLGRLAPAVVRPPLVKLPPHDIERLRQAVAASGLGRDPTVSAAPLAGE